MLKEVELMLDHLSATALSKSIELNGSTKDK